MWVCPPLPCIRFGSWPAVVTPVTCTRYSISFTAMRTRWCKEEINMNKSAIHFLALGGLLVAGSCWGNGGHFNVDDASIAPGGTCGLETWASRLEATEIAVLRPSCNFTGNVEWALPA